MTNNKRAKAPEEAPEETGFEDLESIKAPENTAGTKAKMRHEGHPVHEEHDDDPYDGYQFEELPPIDFSQPSKLAAPPPRHGWVQRWIRVFDAYGNVLQTQWQQRQREGWKPRSPSTIKEKYWTTSTPVAQMGGSVIQNGEMMLAEMPEPRYAQIRAALRQKRDRLSASTRRDLIDKGASRNVETNHDFTTRVELGNGSSVTVKND